MNNNTRVNAVLSYMFSKGVKTYYHRNDGAVVSVLSVDSVGWAVFEGNELKFVTESFEQLQDWIMIDIGLLEEFR